MNYCSFAEQLKKDKICVFCTSCLNIIQILSNIRGKCVLQEATSTTREKSVRAGGVRATGSPYIRPESPLLKAGRLYLIFVEKYQKYFALQLVSSL